MIPLPLVTASPPLVQVAVGELIKPSTVLDTVQVKLYTIPAMAESELLTMALIAVAGTERKEKIVKFT